MAQKNGDSAESTSQPSVSSLVKHFDSETSYTSRSGYAVRDRSVTIESTEISSTQRINVDPSRRWDIPNSRTVHLTSNPTKAVTTSTCDSFPPDFGIIRINYPDSVAWLHPRTDGVTKEVLSGVLTAISNVS